MKYIYFLMFFSLVFTSCKTGKLSKNTQKYDSKKKLIKAFKQEVFCECLKVNFKNDSIFKLIRKEDFFDTSDYLSFKAIDRTRELALKHKKKIPKWEVLCDDCNSTTYKKPIFSYCLDFYTSSKLDSIAKLEYKNK